MKEEAYESCGEERRMNAEATGKRGMSDRRSAVAIVVVVIAVVLDNDDVVTMGRALLSDKLSIR